MYFKKVPSFFSTLFPQAIWRLSTQQKVYLTFDDGPDPSSTPALLNALDQLNIKASFFCLGHKADTYPELIHDIRHRGHCIGNHGYNHLSGWSTTYTAYIDNIDKASTILDTRLYRPPYGRLTPQQYMSIAKNHHIIMWDNMPGDFDTKLNHKNVIINLKTNVSQGSIIVLHDTLYSWSKNYKILAEFKSYIDTQNWEFGLLSDTLLTEKKLLDHSS